MIIKRKFVKAITHPRLICLYLLGRLAPYISNDRLYIKLKFFIYFGKKCNLNSPKSFQEKLQWIKFNDRKTIYHRMVDKIEMKHLVISRVGKEFVIPTLGVWDAFEDIDFESLPDKFILKCTFDSGSYYICQDKSKLNIEQIKSKLLINWKFDYYIYSREWPYKGLKHRIIAEPLIADPHDLNEYKFFCFNGEPRFYQTCQDRDNSKGGAILNFFDLKGNLLDVNDAGHARETLKPPSLPVNLEQMLSFCRLFAKETYFLRVDFYEVDNRIYIGEFTFFENGGWCYFNPKEYNQMWGDWIKLPIDNV